MSWNADLQHPGESQTQGSDASTIPPTAPNRSQLNSEITIAVQTGVPQQGAAALTGKPPVMAGSQEIHDRWFYQ